MVAQAENLNLYKTNTIVVAIAVTKREVYLVEESNNNI